MTNDAEQIRQQPHVIVTSPYDRCVKPLITRSEWCQAIEHYAEGFTMTLPNPLFKKLANRKTTTHCGRLSLGKKR
ncbi:MULTISPECIES: hypothetical protein [Rhizobium]|uniref:hypothetical protein n=1 Tax=Rhizobium TaxID=379 RepID=UPI0016116C31|nr:MULTISPECIES: hypothetical protein [Rhizobium]MBB6305584.1 hypothetical protein [Rhizobium leucaenae]MDK4743621.1 hypothetical protein [Rhizobium sp. CNPSo 3464]